MRIVELLLDEESLQAGIQAISIVESPAIEEDFVALKEEARVELKTIDEDKRVLLGAALVPNKPIYRRNGEDEYYIYFSQDTVRKASELFFINGNQNKATLEHQIDITGLSVVESWIIEGEQDKSKMYGMDLPVGTWMVSMKVHNDEIWNDYVKSGKVKGFSIEGYFVDKVEASKVDPQEVEAEKKLKEIEDVILSAMGVKLGSEKEMKRVANKVNSFISKLKKSASEADKIYKKVSSAKKIMGELDSYDRDLLSMMREIRSVIMAYEQKAKEIGVHPKLNDTYVELDNLFDEVDEQGNKARESLKRLESLLK